MTASSAAPKVSILIAVRNEGRHLARTLESICAQSCPAEWFEVLVLDGGSTDDTVAVAHGFSDRLGALRVLDNPRTLSAAGWNLGLQHAVAPVVSILSGHVRLPSNFYAELLDELTPGRAGVGGKAVPVGDDTRSILIARAFSCLLGNGGAAFMVGDSSRSVETIAFGCYWREALLKIGGFDENIVRGQDWDLNLRLRASGQTLWYLKHLEVQYFTRSTYKTLWKRQFLAGRWKRYIHGKSRKPFLARHWVPAAFVLVLTATTLVSLLWPPALLFLFTGLLAHIGCTAIQMRALRMPWDCLPHFWWAVWLIHVGYGTGMMVSLLSSHPARPQ